MKKTYLYYMKQTVWCTATNPPEFWGRVDIVDIVDIRVDIRISKNPDV